MKRFMSISLATLLSCSLCVPALAGVADANFFGGQDSSEDIYTLMEMENVSAVVDTINGFNTPEIFVNPTLSDYSNSNLNSGFVYIAGHGSYDSIATGKGSGISSRTISNFKNISNTSFENAQCVILAACSTAADVGNELGLGFVIEKNKANYVLGWLGTVDTGTLSLFNEEFVSELANGKTFMNAYIAAKNTVSNEFSEQIELDNPIWDSYMAGNINSKLNNPSTREATVDNENTKLTVEDLLNSNLEQHIVTESIKKQSTGYKNLEKYIQEYIDSKFDLENYVIREDQTTDTVDFVEFRYKVNELETDYGFTVVYIDDEAAMITFTKDHAEVNIDTLSSIPVTVANENDLFSNAIKDDGFDNVTVEEQNLRSCLDANTGKIVNTVKTVYKDEQGLYFATSHSY